MGRGAVAALSIIGGIMLCIGAIVKTGLLKLTLLMHSILDQYSNAVNVQLAVTLLFGIFAIIIGIAAGCTTTNTGIRVCAGFLLLFGLAASLCQFVPYAVVAGIYPPNSLTITVSTTLIYIDPLLMIVAAVCGFATNQEHWVYTPPPPLQLQQQQVIHMYVPQPPVQPPPAQSASHFCIQCGAKNEADAKFCKKCGAAIE